MSYELVPIKGKDGLLGKTTTYDLHITAANVAGLVCSVTASNLSGGITNLNPATLTLEQSWDNAATWVTVLYTKTILQSNPVIQTIYGDGVYIISPTPQSGRLSPLVRLSVNVPAGESLIVSTLLQTAYDSNDVSSIVSTPDLTITTTAGATSFNVNAVLTEVSTDSVTPANNVGLPTVTLTGQGKVEASSIEKSPAAAQHTIDVTHTPMTSSIIMGWNSATSKHEEVLIGVDGKVLSTADMSFTYGPSGSLFSNPITYCTNDKTQNYGLPTVALIGQEGAAVSGAEITNASYESNDIKATATFSIAMGWNGTTHKEVGLGAQGSVRTVPVYENKLQSGRQDFTSNSLSDTPETILTLTDAIYMLDINDTSGYAINVYVDTVFQFTIPPGGCTYPVSPTVFDAGSVITIAAHTGVTISTGELIFNTFSAWSSF